LQSSSTFDFSDIFVNTPPNKKSLDDTTALDSTLFMLQRHSTINSTSVISAANNIFSSASDGLFINSAHSNAISDDSLVFVCPTYISFADKKGHTNVNPPDVETLNGISRHFGPAEIKGGNSLMESNLAAFCIPESGGAETMIFVVWFDNGVMPNTLLVASAAPNAGAKTKIHAQQSTMQK
jgi:hypothetical protein